jgi:hypothetical protein
MTTQNPPPRTIRCNADNAAEFQALVKSDPELLAIVKHLQASGLFPGLRAMSITLTGSAAQQAQGLAAWAASIPASPDTPAGQQGAACK